MASETPHEPAALPPEPDAESRQGLSKHFTEQFWSVSNKTNTTLLVWITSVILIFLSIIVPLSMRLQKFNSLRTRLRQATQRQAKFASQYKKDQEAKGASQSKEFQKDSTTTADVTKLRESEQTTARISQEKTQLKQEISTLKTPLGDLNLPEVYVPLVWSLLFAGLLGFFLYRRLLLQAMLAQAVTIQVRDLGKSVQNITCMGIGAPFWLAPLPQPATDSDEAATHLRAFLGWEIGERQRNFLTVACVVFGFLMYLWVLFVAWGMIGENKDDPQHMLGYGDPQHMIRVAVTITLIMVLCLTACAYLMRPRLKYGLYPQKLLEESKSRRRFLYLSGALTLAGLAYVLTPRGILPKSLTARVPRCRRPKGIQTEPFGSGVRKTFQMHSKSRVIHYINDEGWVLGRVRLNLKNFQPKTTEEVVALQVLEQAQLQQRTNQPPPEKESSAAPTPQPSPPRRPLLAQSQPQDILQKPVPAPDDGGAKQDGNGGAEPEPHFNIPYWGALSERLALKHIEEGRPQQALDILWGAIVRDTKLKKGRQKRPSYRLYDLFAGLAVRAQNNGSQAKLDKHILQSWGTDPALARRREKLSTPPEKWVAKWRGEALPWKPPTGTPKDYRARCLKM